MKKTALHPIHVHLNAKMVPFAGFEMPIQYHGIRAEHRRVRETVGVFDVSHMGEIEISGDRAFEMVQKITINDAAQLQVGQVQYSAMCYDNGGIVDDLLVYKFDTHYLLVVNDQNTVEYRPVQTGSLFQGMRVIKEGLDPEDRVIINGVQKARPGITVQPADEPNKRPTQADSGPMTE